MAALGAALLVLGLLALTWSAGGPRLLVGAVGLFGVVRGVAALRSARTGDLGRAGAVSAAATLWLGIVAAALAAVSATATGWLLVVAGVALLPVLAAALPARRTPLLGAA